MLTESEETLFSPPPSPAREKGLRVVLAGCTNVLNDLQALVDRYENLDSKVKINPNQLRWCKEDIPEIRGRLTSNVTLLTGFVW